MVSYEDFTPERSIDIEDFPKIDQTLSLYDPYNDETTLLHIKKIYPSKYLVYKAYDPHLERSYLLKFPFEQHELICPQVISAFKTLLPQRKKQLKYELEIINELQAKDIISEPLTFTSYLHHISLPYFESSIPVLAMNYLDALSVNELSNQFKENKSYCAFSYFYHTITQLHAMHTHDYIHNDIKPNNILFFPLKKKAQLIDFESTSKRYDVLPETFSTSYTAPELLSTFLHVNTNPIYTYDHRNFYDLSDQEKKKLPKAYYQILSRNRHKQDIYSLGCTLYHYLSSVTPFHSHAQFNNSLLKRKEEVFFNLQDHPHSSCTPPHLLAIIKATKPINDRPYSAKEILNYCALNFLAHNATFCSLHHLSIEHTYYALKELNPHVLRAKPLTLPTIELPPYFQFVLPFSLKYITTYNLEHHKHLHNHSTELYGFATGTTIITPLPQDIDINESIHLSHLFTKLKLPSDHIQNFELSLEEIDYSLTILHQHFQDHLTSLLLPETLKAINKSPLETQCLFMMLNGLKKTHDVIAYYDLPLLPKSCQEFYKTPYNQITQYIAPSVLESLFSLPKKLTSPTQPISLHTFHANILTTFQQYYGSQHVAHTLSITTKELHNILRKRNLEESTCVPLTTLINYNYQLYSAYYSIILKDKFTFDALSPEEQTNYFITHANKRLKQLHKNKK